MSPGEAAAGTPVHDWPPEHDDTRSWDEQYLVTEYRVGYQFRPPPP